MLRRRDIALIASFLLVAGCAEEPPPRSVTEFMDNPILLEAALVRCTQNRAESRYDAECVNAREAVRILEAAEDEKRRAELEAQSERKREALRRTQRAAAEARRRAAEAQRRREEEEYLAQFGELPPSTGVTDEPLAGNVPGAVLPDPDAPQEAYSPPEEVLFEPAPPPATETTPVAEQPAVGSNAPVAEAAPEEEPEEAPADLQAVREELQRRNEAGDNN